MAAIFDDLNDPKLVDLLLDGQVGVLPTDTIYGIVCRAADTSAAKRLYNIKPRVNKAGTIIAADIEQLVELGLKRRYLTAVKEYWPGPLTVIIPSSDPEFSYLHKGLGGLAVRVVDHKKLIKLLKKTGPLLTTSTNPPDEKPADNITEAMAYFGKKLDFFVDGGDLSNNKPSTIIRIVDDAIEVLREGAVKIKPNE